MKRLLALILCLVMCLSLVPAAGAEGDAANAVPTITAQPKSVTAAVGGTATFTVSASGGSLSYQWQYRTSSSGSWTNSTVSGAKTASLSISAESHRSGYQYRCKVTNSSGAAYSSAATLTVVTKPTITAQPKSVTAALGGTATFTVSASGGSLSYQWQYRTSSSGSWANSTVSGAKTASLSISAESHRSGYQYRCRVKNAAGTTYSSAATLTVVTKPAITAQPKSVTAVVGSTASFTVSASGGSLSYQWQYRTSASGSWVNSTVTGAKTATLSISVESHRSGYQYRCKVKNAAGTAYSSAATLTVASKPTITVQPQSVSATTGSLVAFTVTAIGASSYQWQYRTSASGSWMSSTATGANTSVLSINAESSRNGYQYRCKVTNAAGSVYSAAATLTVTGGRIVYWVPDGYAYHSTTSCRSLSRSKEIISGTIEEAIATGHDSPCKNCW